MAKTQSGCQAVHSRAEKAPAAARTWRACGNQSCSVRHENKFLTQLHLAILVLAKIVSCSLASERFAPLKVCRFQIGATELGLTEVRQAAPGWRCQVRRSFQRGDGLLHGLDSWRRTTSES